MAKEDDVIKDADFEKLLDSFINAKIEDKNDENPTANKNNDISLLPGSWFTLLISMVLISFPFSS